MIDPIRAVVAVTVAALLLAGCTSAAPANPSRPAGVSGPVATVASVASRAVVATAPAPLDISSRFRKPVTLKNCSTRSAVLTRNPAQPVRGFVGCAASGTSTVPRLSFLESTSTGWRVTRTGFSGNPMAVTDDGRSTLLLYSVPQPGQSGYLNVWLLRRGSSGATHRVRLASHVPTSVQEASIVARGGAWWAVWTEMNENGPWLWSAKTLGGRQKAHRSIRGRSPSLLRQGDSVLLAYTGGYRPEGNTIYTARPSGAGWRREPGSVSGGAKPYDDVASHPQLARIGGKVMIAYLHMVARQTPYGENDLVLAVRSGKSWKRHSFGTTTAGPPSLLDSAGQPVLAWTAITPHYRGGMGWTSERQVIRMAARHGTRWTKASWSLDTFPYLVAMRGHRGDLVAVVEDDMGKARLLHQ